MRVAIYARSAVRNDAAIEEQAAACRAHASAEGWTVVHAYADSGVSGMTMARPGMAALLRDASARTFDAVIATDIKRLSRNFADLMAVRSTLRECGVVMVMLDQADQSAA